MAAVPVPQTLNQNRLLFSLTSANMNSTADQQLSQAFSFSRYIIKEIVVTNASTSMTTAVGGMYGAASKAAPIIVAASQVYSALTTSTKILNPTLAAAAQEVLSAANLYLSLTTPQGATATADVYVMGIALS